MSHADLVDHLASTLAGVAPDVLEQALDALADGDVDLDGLSREQIVEIVSAAVFGVASAVTKDQLARRRPRRS
jgi:hypothetical protein